MPPGPLIVPPEPLIVPPDAGGLRQKPDLQWGARPRVGRERAMARRASKPYHVRRTSPTTPARSYRPAMGRAVLVPGRGLNTMGTMTFPRPAGGGVNGASRTTSAAHARSSCPPFHWSTATWSPLPLGVDVDRHDRAGEDRRVRVLRRLLAMVQALAHRLDRHVGARRVRVVRLRTCSAPRCVNTAGTVTVADPPAAGAGGRASPRRACRRAPRARDRTRPTSRPMRPCPSGPPAGRAPRGRPAWDRRAGRGGSSAAGPCGSGSRPRWSDVARRAGAIGRPRRPARDRRRCRRPRHRPRSPEPRPRRTRKAGATREWAAPSPAQSPRPEGSAGSGRCWSSRTSKASSSTAVRPAFTAGTRGGSAHAAAHRDAGRRP